jgi:hypothetical protein
MTRTFRIIAPTASSRAERLTRARTRVKDEARSLYYAARETRALYELETQARVEAEHAAAIAKHDAREALRAAMAVATVRVYATPPVAPADSPDWRLPL